MPHRNLNDVIRSSFRRR